jgi:hypothetical protein
MIKQYTGRNIQNDIKLYQMAIQYINPIVIKYANIFHSKAKCLP